ncbi:MAG: PDZ domain-containing protein [Oscillospiraceae bacterium]|jgi:carboxyl-terminal processing protease|nr:PDZ domain-containing protein [Oscillospiraceae bacterium]
MREQWTQAAEKPKRKWWKPTGPAKIAIAVLLTLLLSTGLWCLALGPSGIAMVQTYLLARFAFVEPDADLEEATDKALSAFVDGLGDRWSYYLPAQRHQETIERRANSYVGIGVTVDSVSREEGLLVQSVTRDGPADKAGVLAGDVITAVDGVSIAGEGRETASDRIRGEEGTKVALSLLGEDGASRDVTCTRATLHNASAQGRLLDDKVGYVQLSNFYSGSADSFQAEVDALLEQGAESLLIDLRGDPGGYVSELEQILDYLLPEGPVFTHKPRWWFKSVYVSDENCVDLPMAVLVNQHSYSAAELLAAQLRESVDAPIVGERTSGKGYSQLTFPLANGGGAGLSTAAYCTGSGHSLIGEGIVPDVELSLPEGAALGGEDDVQLKAALELLVADGG